MTNDEINKRIAELCGWQWTSQEVWQSGGKHFVRNGMGEQSRKLEDYLPSYTSDLNACASFENTLRENQFHYVNYPRHLFQIVTGITWGGDMGYFFFDYAFAAAIQRCHAFLLTHSIDPTK